MADWRRVKWSEARQVLDILGSADAAAESEAAKPPALYFHYLREAGRNLDAVKFLGQALPRLEAVGWAARMVRDLEPEGLDRNRPEAKALRAALLWLADPTEGRRRAAFDASEACDTSSPEALAAKAAFFSGGSIAPADATPLPAPRDAAGRFASGAVMLAAARRKDMAEALNRALDAGAKIAALGLEAADA